ncbi:MAG: DUF1588 domain-containing protein [Rubripirellula sp.]|nr:DUF1588 domain-containing protein [Rubripirellula sp.]
MLVSHLVVNPIWQWCLILTALFVMVAPESFAVEQGGDEISFEQNVEPFLVKHCYDCHAGDGSEAGFDLQQLPSDFTADRNVNRWMDVMHSLQFGEMPPAEEMRPNQTEQANVVSWVFQKLAETDRYDAYRKKMLAPEYGNWVSHEKLFSGEIDTPPFSPSRLWRFSPEIFKSKGFGRVQNPFTYVTPETGIRDYSGMSKADQSTAQTILINADQFLEQREQRGEFKVFAEKAPTPSDQILASTIGREFRRVIGRDPLKEERRKYLAFLKENIEAGGNLDGLKTTIKAMFLSPEAIYRMEFGLGETDQFGRRHLSPNELAYALAYALTDRGPQHTAAIKIALEKELLNDKADVARLVTQLLDEQLWAGRWDNQGLPRVIRFFDEFFGFHRAGEVFKDLDRQRREGIAQWNPQMLIHDARMLIEHVLKHDKDVIAELLTTNEWFIAHPGDNEYAREFYEARIAEITSPDFIQKRVAKRKEGLDREAKQFQIPADEAERRLNQIRNDAKQKVQQFETALKDGRNPHPNFPFSNRSRGIADLLYIESYNLPSNSGVEEQRWTWPVEQPLSMPLKQRAGLLTHPAWLAAYSLNDGNDPIHRGIWIRERLLAGVIQDVPPDVDAKVSVDPHLTLRERMEPLRAKRCWVCHQKMNPLGETFEIFDDWGRYRSHVYFDGNDQMVSRRDGTFDRMRQEGKLTERKIDASGSISGSSDPEVDGEVEDAIEMLNRIGHSQRARQSFIRHLFRYLMGRNEMLSDSVTLIDAEHAYLENDGSFKALVVSLLSSDSFLYRR